jgi:hypothetical protein
MRRSRVVAAFLGVAIGLSANPSAADDASCVAQPCSGDTDCDPAMRCIPGADSNCSPDGGSGCGLCVVRWQTACDVDDDCGEGFACMPSGLDCDCPKDLGDAAVPDGAMITGCDDADVPQVCEAGGACLAAPLCDAGSCLCRTVKVCVEKDVACDAAVSCGDAEMCNGGNCVPKTWCDSGSCEPPCFATAREGGAVPLTPPDGSNAQDPVYSQSKWPGCGCRTAGPTGGGVAWRSLLCLGLIAQARRRRRARGPLDE